MIKKASTYIACAILASGCAMPNHMEFQLHDTPDNKDKEVRFHSVYYYRVIDSCEPPKPGRISNATKDLGLDKVILSDTLYRFTLVGKANAFFKKVKFESGTLRADQIDPFGNTIAHDKDGNLRLGNTSQSELRLQEFDSMEADIEKSS